MTGFSAGTTAACCVAATTGVVALVVKMSMGRKRTCAQIRVLNFIEHSPVVWRHHRLNLSSGRRTDIRPFARMTGCRLGVIAQERPWNGSATATPSMTVWPLTHLLDAEATTTAKSRKQHARKL